MQYPYSYIYLILYGFWGYRLLVIEKLFDIRLIKLRKLEVIGYQKGYVF